MSILHRQILFGATANFLSLLLLISSGTSQVINPEYRNSPEFSAANEFHYQVSSCISFHITVNGCMTPEVTPQDLMENNPAIRFLVDIAKTVGNMIGISEDAFKSRIDLEAESMIDLMNYECINISSILSRFGGICRAISDNPTEFFRNSSRDN